MSDFYVICVWVSVIMFLINYRNFWDFKIQRLILAYVLMISVKLQFLHD